LWDRVPLGKLGDDSRSWTSNSRQSTVLAGGSPTGAAAFRGAAPPPADTGTLTGWRLRFYYGEHGAN